MKEMMKILCKC